MDPQLKKNLSSAEYWFRAVYSVLFLVCAKIAGILILIISVAQIIFTLVTGQPNARLVQLGGNLAEYIFTIFNFVTCKSEDKPYPFADWPAADPVTDECEGEVVSPVVDAAEAQAEVEAEVELTESQSADSDGGSNKDEEPNGKATQDA